MISLLLKFVPLRNKPFFSKKIDKIILIALLVLKKKL